MPCAAFHACLGCRLNRGGGKLIGGFFTNFFHGQGSFHQMGWGKFFYGEDCVGEAASGRIQTIVLIFNIPPWLEKS